MNKKGFTLIELLAVIIILGILMIIAIPSVTKYISDSRKNAYVDTAKEVIGSARNFVNSGDLEMFDTDVTYYIDVKCINTENALKSPYGEFTKAFVVVTYNGKGYDYYWTSVDDAGQGIKDIVKYDKLDIENIESDLTDDDISTLRGVDGRSQIILITGRNNCQKEGKIGATEYISANGTNTGAVMYPKGKDENTLSVGDLVKIGTEEFYVVSNDSEGLKLFARYNLKVGTNYDFINGVKTTISPSEPGYGLQSSEMYGVDENYTIATGYVSFSNSNYWQNNVGEGKKYSDYYVYDSNSKLYPYLENYKNYLKTFGVDPIVRLCKERELMPLSNAGLNKIVHSSSFWAGYSVEIQSSQNFIVVHYLSEDPYTNGTASYNSAGFGIRPIIIINNN